MDMGVKMDRRTATEEIKARWKELYPADGQGKGIICPLRFNGQRCGNGSGKSGTGIRINPNSKSRYNLTCFKCGFNGSIIDLYMQDTGETSFSKAVDELAARLNISIDPYTGGTRATAAEDFAESAGGDLSFNGKSSILDPAEISQPAANYQSYYEKCMANLEESFAGSLYLAQRCIGLDTAKACCIGFDPAWISPTVIRNQKAKGSDWLPAPKPVIIIPTTMQHYVARDIRPDDEMSEQEQQYKKTNEGKPGIFNAHKAFNSGAENIFVTEGAFDALSVLEVGQQAIALNSTSNADKLIEFLKEHPTKATLILCLDSDEAGRRTEARLKNGLNRLNISYTTANINGSYKDPNEALVENREEFEKAIAQAIATNAARPDNTAAYLDNLMAGEIERFKQAQDRKTGFSNLDEKAGGGLYTGLYVLAAISSLGKTTLALQMADQIAAQGHEVLFFSMEMSRFEMVSKSLARLTAQADMRTAVTSLSIRKGFLPTQVTAAAAQYKARIGERMSIIEGNFNCDIAYIANYIRRYKQRTSATPVVFIDYLQILQPAAEGRSRGSKKDEIDLAVTELKRLSRELDLPIIVISSLNRANYLTPFAFESLKESGGIEYTADVVWGMQLACLDEELFDEEKKIKKKRKRIEDAKEENPRKIKFICIKNRYGTSHYECYFDYYSAFELLVPAAAPAGSGSGYEPKKVGRRI